MITSNFRGADDHDYYVEIYGEGVDDGYVDIVGVTISMATHDRKFVGFKSTTCKIDVLTDKPLTTLYASNVRDISVKITDETISKVVFAGYVVPFTFEQPYTGTADVVTIDCVDAVTAAKDIPYVSVEDDDKYGIDVTAEDIVLEMRNRAGGYDKIRSVVYHSNFDYNNSSSKVFDTKVAQAGFIQDEMTCLDALNAVCMFFGYTCAMVGDSLCFYDEHCLVNATDTYKRNAHVVRWDYGIDGKIAKTETKYYNSASSPLKLVALNDSHDDITVSVERAYDAIQVTPSGSSTSVLLPDVCGRDNVDRNTDGRGTEAVLTGGDTYREYRLPVQSKVMDLGEWKDGGIARWDSYSKLQGNGWEGGAMLLNINRNDITRTTQYGQELIYPTGISDKTLIWMRYFYSEKGARVGLAHLGYSHTGGYIEVRVKYHLVDLGTDADDSVGNWTNSSDYYTTSFVQIHIGDKYYNNGYTTTGLLGNSAEGVMLWKDGKLIPTRAASNVYENKFLLYIDDSSQIRVELGWDGTPAMASAAMFIEQLEVVGYGDDIYTGGKEFRHEYKSNPDSVLAVDTALTTRNSWRNEAPTEAFTLGINARPGIVPALYYSGGGYMGRKEREIIGGCGILLEQLKSRYGEPHLRYSMTVDGSVSPTDTIQFGGKLYTIEGYERDLVNNTTKVTIN